ncbi:MULTISPECIES: DUF4033 domain-containing protein [unclassified Roseofilum]|uniref:DUF4033 domain-containing protein n=1 Tax=unclassified Roseofilum TaxID=2620099 RepID=UPI000E8E631A|nr:MULTISPECIES: DUF4033 domain-containing protein [unclassified Roseofilum]HBQ98936.1 DUF4033 domain-containing protein [Cyanobacteria bacterium UBA11691]MBP0007631.1 DUF4033 domain-containing protein [Roseofilum sp. Belize Diploria]MBP0012916.1 DUF4033 domain-containing protein [Roseofilum sp. SID3]MBP0026569.1 DUF4033 domain-containing protein [Roseofilum sp. SID2]MBP0034806.1 DUF4033 domain-containing protein [Roseofilum sp. Belize BBD 4]
MTVPEPTSYHDNLCDRLFIALFTRKMAAVVGKGSSKIGYEGFVDVSQKIMQGRNSLEQQQLVKKVLNSLIPAPILTIIRTLTSPTQWVCEANAWFATLLFEWLVGPCETKTVEIKNKNQTIRQQKSAVQIKKCRYLEQSGCVGMCINMCKLPTQDFFTQQFGIPLTMTPNFEDFSCEMVFGQYPQPLEQEAAFEQSCLKDHCAIASVKPEPCPRVRDRLNNK